MKICCFIPDKCHIVVVYRYKIVLHLCVFILPFVNENVSHSSCVNGRVASYIKQIRHACCCLLLHH